MLDQWRNYIAHWPASLLYAMVRDMAKGLRERVEATQRAAARLAGDMALRLAKGSVRPGDEARWNSMVEELYREWQDT